MCGTCPAPGGGSKGDDSVLYPDPGLLIVSLQTGPAVPLTGPSPVVPLRADIGGPDDVSIALPTLLGWRCEGREGEDYHLPHCLRSV